MSTAQTTTHGKRLSRSLECQPVEETDQSVAMLQTRISRALPNGSFGNCETLVLEYSGSETLVVCAPYWQCFLCLRESRPAFPSIQQWWDFGKTQIKQLCQQFTRNVTKDLTWSMKYLERQANSDLLSLLKPFFFQRPDVVVNCKIASLTASECCYSQAAATHLAFLQSMPAEVKQRNPFVSQRLSTAVPPFQDNSPAVKYCAHSQGLRSSPQSPTPRI
ncbi:hypothetical protein F2P81_009501 [Scophthalmus maximus]|uniref:Uncharacterized protein n=1 Tax=Scophthalmus maximus TaxID=52904 RepID=A0A6A4SZ97_SCOMX|nr:hypothetical protein F2P81_009501 [Scophthalmus maximus]